MIGQDWADVLMENTSMKISAKIMCEPVQDNFWSSPHLAHDRPRFDFVMEKFKCPAVNDDGTCKECKACGANVKYEVDLRS